jgi:DNA helicase-2/ATP-dependent DNA helicase PcrA
MIDAVHHVEEIDGVTGRARQSIERFSQQIRHAQGQMHQSTVAEAMRKLLAEVRLRENVVGDNGSGKAAQARWNGVEFLLESVDKFERRAWDKQAKPKWNEYLGNLDLKKKDDDEQPPDLVTLSTFHSAKGLEWGNVFILGVEEGTLPHKRTEAPRLSDAISGDVEEERRLLYVGITRARDRLWLMRAATRVDRGREFEVLPSRFLNELPGEDSGVIEQYDVRDQEKLSTQTMEELADAFMNQLAGSGSRP